MLPSQFYLVPCICFRVAHISEKTFTDDNAKKKIGMVIQIFWNLGVMYFMVTCCLLTYSIVKPGLTYLPDRYGMPQSRELYFYDSIQHYDGWENHNHMQFAGRSYQINMERRT